MQRDRKTQTGSARGFSLIEILAVMAIMSVMTALMIPSISGFSSTAGRRGSVNVLMNAFEQARAEALEKSANILVVMRRHPNASEDSFIVVRDNRSADLPSTEPEFVALTRWQKLSKGVLFFQAAGSLTVSGATLPTGNRPGGTDALPNALPGSVPKEELFAIGFNRHGQVSFPASGAGLSLYIAEAQRNESADAKAKGASLAITERLSFRRYTGRAQLDFTAPPQS